MTFHQAEVAAISVLSRAARLGLIFLVAADGAAAQQVPALADRLNVREVELVLDPPPMRRGLADMKLGDLEPTDTPVGPGVKFKLPARKGLADLGAGDLVVMEGGRSRPVLRVEPLASGGGSPWTLRVYFDLVLARPDTVAEAALALAGQAAQLAQLGTVEITVADPAPRTVLAPSRAAAAIAESLASLAGRASRDPLARQGARNPPPTATSVRRQCDRLVTHLLNAGAAGPHALLWIADSPSLAPAELELLTAVSTPANPPLPTPGPFHQAAAERVAGPSPALVLGETARLLAAYGWVTVALPIHRLTGSEEREKGDALARSRGESLGNVQPPAGFPVVGLIVALVRYLRGKHPEPTHDARLVAPQLDMANAPLVAMVRPTAGTVITYRQLLGPALGALAARWHLWYQADASPAGREIPLSVSLLANGLDWRAPRWSRSGTPEDLAAARLRRLLDGDGGQGPLPISFTWLPAPQATNAARLELAVAPPSDARDRATAGPWRLSLAWTDPAGNDNVTHQLVAGAAPASENGGQELRFAAPPAPAGATRFAVLIEDLGSERWGAAVVAR